MSQQPEVRISIDQDGQEHHAIEMDAGAFANHPHIDGIRNCIQYVLSEMESPGVAASIGVPFADVQKKIAAGEDPADLADQVQNAALAKWVEGAARAGKLEQTAANHSVEGVEYTVARVGAVVFTDAQFGEFLRRVTLTVLGYLDAAIETAEGRKPS